MTACCSLTVAQAFTDLNKICHIGSGREISAEFVSGQNPLNRFKDSNFKYLKKLYDLDVSLFLKINHTKQNRNALFKFLKFLITKWPVITNERNSS